MRIPSAWHLETGESDRADLATFWQTLAPALRVLDPRLTFPELLNEPVFPRAPGQWQALQDQLLHAVRIALPQYTVVLTGNDWGSVAGLTALRPVADGNVLYSFHFYEPAELTALAAYRSALDRVALARLPFPADPAAYQSWPRTRTPTPRASSGSTARCTGTPPASPNGSRPRRTGRRPRRRIARRVRRFRGTRAGCPRRLVTGRA